MDTGTRGRNRRRVALAPLIAVTAALFLTACGGDGSSELPSVTRSGLPTAVPSVTASLPSLTRSPSAEPSPEESQGTPTAEASETPTKEASETPTKEASVTPTPEPSNTPKPEPSKTPSETSRPTPTRTAVATATVTTTASEEATPEASPTASALAPAAEDAEDTGLAWWVWLLIAAVLAGAALAAVLVSRSRRRSAWTADLATAEAEAAWFSRDLLPQLQSAGTADALAGGWQVASPRVMSLEDRLNVLEGSAPDEVSRTRAGRLRDAVLAARQNVEGIVLSRDVSSAPRELRAVAAQLAPALAPPTAVPRADPGGPTGPPA